MNALIDRNVTLKAFPKMPIQYAAIVCDVLENAPAVDQWISVRDRLPDTDGEYLVYTDHYEIVEYDTELRQFGHTDEYKDELGYNIVEWYEVHNVTHWMPLPNKPINGKDE